MKAAVKLELLLLAGIVVVSAWILVLLRGRMEEAFQVSTGVSEVFQVNKQATNGATAEAVCATYGAKVATKAQLQDALDAGAQWCSCGWTNNGGTYDQWYPTKERTPNGWCGYINSLNGCGTGHLERPVNCYGVKPPIGTPSIYNFYDNPDNTATNIYNMPKIRNRVSRPQETYSQPTANRSTRARASVEQPKYVQTDIVSSGTLSNWISITLKPSTTSTVILYIVKIEIYSNGVNILQTEPGICQLNTDIHSAFSIFNMGLSGHTLSTGTGDGYKTANKKRSPNWVFSFVKEYIDNTPFIVINFSRNVRIERIVLKTGTYYDNNVNTAATTSSLNSYILSVGAANSFSNYMNAASGATTASRYELQNHWTDNGFSRTIYLNTGGDCPSGYTYSQSINQCVRSCAAGETLVGDTCFKPCSTTSIPGVSGALYEWIATRQCREPTPSNYTTDGCTESNVNACMTLTRKCDDEHGSASEQKDATTCWQPCNGGDTRVERTCYRACSGGGRVVGGTCYSPCPAEMYPDFIDSDDVALNSKCYPKEMSSYLNVAASGRIQLASDPNKCVALPGGVPYFQNGKRVGTWDCGGTGVDGNWTFTKEGTIVNNYNRKCLDLDMNGSFLQTWECHGGANQQWTIRDNGLLSSRAAGDTCITLNSSNALITTSCTPSTNNRWITPALSNLAGAARAQTKAPPDLSIFQTNYQNTEGFTAPA